jgi:hypothetical protein
MTTKFRNITHSPKIEVKEVMAPLSSTPTFMGYASSILGNCDECGSNGEQFGNLGNMVPTSKSKKIELWTPSLTPPKGK